MTLTAAQKKAINLAEDQVKVAAEIMIEKPMEFIKAILFKHETAVIEVMKELHEENEALRKRLAAYSWEAENTALRAELETWKKDSAAGWGKCEERRIENEALRKERDELVAALKGLAFGTDWNHGTHAEIYRPQLLAYLAKLDEDKTGETEAERCYKTCNDYACVRNGHCMGSAGK